MKGVYLAHFLPTIFYPLLFCMGNVGVQEWESAREVAGALNTISGDEKEASNCQTR